MSSLYLWLWNWRGSCPICPWDQEQLWEQAWQGLQVSAIEIAAVAALSAFLWKSAGVEQI